MFLGWLCFDYSLSKTEGIWFLIQNSQDQRVREKQIVTASFDLSSPNSFFFLGSVCKHGHFIFCVICKPLLLLLSYENFNFGDIFPLLLVSFFKKLGCDVSLTNPFLGTKIPQTNKRRWDACTSWTTHFPQPEPFSLHCWAFFSPTLSAL